MSDFDNAERDVDSLEREVNEKRAQLDRTLGAVERQLSPTQLIDQTMGYFKEHGGDMSQSLGRTIKDNPLPLVLTGVGLAWLMASQSSSRSVQSDQHLDYYRDRLVNGYDDRNYQADSQHRTHYKPSVPSGESSQYGQSVSNGTSVDYGSDDAFVDGVKDTVDQWGEIAAEMRKSVLENMESLKQGADETLEQWQERTETTLSDLQQSAYDTGRTVRRSAHDTRQTIRQSAYGAGQTMQVRGKEMGNWFQDQPLVTGALGIAVGAIVGSLIPTTRVEDEFVGASADSVKSCIADEISSKASDVREQVETASGKVSSKVQNKVDSFTSESATS